LTRPLVSVVTISYNHARFLEQAVRSALAQTIADQCEILVFDDASTDGTGRIALELQSERPDIVRVVARERNVGMMENFVDAWNSARGEFVALLEGDDWWSDPTKLERQVELLRSDASLGGVAHDVELHFEDGADRSVEAHLHPRDRSQWSLDSLLRLNPFATCSMMYRSATVGRLPDWFKTLPIGDWPLLLLHAKHGPIARIPRSMGFYRIYPSSAWSGQGVLRRLGGSIAMLERMRHEMPPELVPYIDTTIRGLSLHMATRVRRMPEPPPASCLVAERIARAASSEASELRELVRRARIPLLHRWLRFRDRFLLRRALDPRDP